VLGRCNGVVLSRIRKGKADQSRSWEVGIVEVAVKCKSQLLVMGRNKGN
jgi:hypothetical protein